MECYLLGYDIRLKPAAFVDAHWDGDRRAVFLLDETVSAPFSIDAMIWPSVFRYAENRDDRYAAELAELVYVEPTDFLHQVLSLWQNKEAMDDAFRADPSFGMLGDNTVTIAISLLVAAREDLGAEWDFYLSDGQVRPWQCPDGWRFLGYDVADSGTISGLTNCGYGPEEKAALQARYVPRLNGNGLFEDWVVADEFRQRSDERVPEHAPFFVFGLYAPTWDA